MALDLHKHKVPITITLVGFALVAVLANAPQLITHFTAGSANAARIELLEQALADSNEQAEAQIAAQLDSINLQILTLNKAISNLSKKHYRQTLNTDQLEQSISSNNAANDSISNRVRTLEKAVGRINRQNQKAKSPKSLQGSDMDKLNEAQTILNDLIDDITKRN